VALRKIGSWKDIHEDSLIVFRTDRGKEFLYRVLSKDWASKSISVRGRYPNGRPFRTVLFSVPAWIRSGNLRKAKGGTKL